MNVRRFLVLSALGGALCLSAARRADADILLTNLHEFRMSDSITSGRKPTGAPVLARDGNYYGTTRAGGAFSTSDPFGEGYGTIYRLTPDGVLTTIYSFDGTSTRFAHGSLIAAADGNLYGLADSAFYRVTLDGTFTLLHSFGGADDLPYPGSDLMAGPDGTFYGLAAPYSGGNPGTGTIFRLTTDGTLTKVCTFALPDNYGTYQNILLASDGNYYGTSPFSYRGAGFIYRVTPGGVVTVINAFDGSGNGAGGSFPITALIEGRDGALYGTTDAEGVVSYPTGLRITTIYRITLDGTLTMLHVFAGVHPRGGVNPSNPLLLGSDGNFYGTTAGATEDQTDGYTPLNGTIFRLTPDGTFTTLRVLSGTTDGTTPLGSLVELPDGTFLGATTGAGGMDYGIGTIFRLDLDAPPAGPVVTATVVKQDFQVYEHGDPVFEDDVNIGIVFTLDRTTDAELKVYYRVSGSARPGVDYDGLPKKVKFLPGETSKFFRLRSHPGRVKLGGYRRIVRLRLLPGDGYTVGTDVPVRDVLSPYY